MLPVKSLTTPKTLKVDDLLIPVLNPLCFWVLLLGIFNLKLGSLNQSLGKLLTSHDRNIESLNETILQKLGGLAKNIGIIIISQPVSHIIILQQGRIRVIFSCIF